MRFAISDEKEIIMSKKDLKYFMRPTEPEIITAPGPDSFKDSEGKTIDFEIKVLTQSSITKINDRYKRRIMATDKKGNPLINGNTLVFREEEGSPLADVDIRPMLQSLTLAEEPGLLRLEAVVSAQNPGLNPALLAAAVGAYLPELAPDFVQARRLELLDAGGGVFR